MTNPVGTREQREELREAMRIEAHSPGGATVCQLLDGLDIAEEIIRLGRALDARVLEGDWLKSVFYRHQDKVAEWDKWKK